MKVDFNTLKSILTVLKTLGRISASDYAKALAVIEVLSFIFDFKETVSINDLTTAVTKGFEIKKLFEKKEEPEEISEVEDYQKTNVIPTPSSFLTGYPTHLDTVACFSQPGMIPLQDEIESVPMDNVFPVSYNRSQQSLNWNIGQLRELASHFIYDSTKRELKIIVMTWDAVAQKFLTFKDWSVDCPPGRDSRWYKNNDLQKNGNKVNAYSFADARAIVCMVLTNQPTGSCTIHKVLAHSQEITL